MTFNAADWLVDRWCSSGHGAAVAYQCQDRTVSYGSLQALTCRAANALRSIGVQPGDRFVMVVVDNETFPAFFLGGLRLGAIPVPVSTMIRPAEVAAIASDAGAAAMVVSPGYAGHLSSVALPSLVVDPTSWSGDEAWVAPYPSSLDTPAFWLYTSGTTGQPKGAIHCHGDIQVVASTYAQSVLGITAGDVCYSIAKLFFAFGLGNALFFPLSVGASAVIDPAPPTPLMAASLLSSRRPTLFFAPPGFCAAMVDASVPEDCTASVRYTVTAGECLPAEVMKRFTERFGTEMLDGIGSTEALHIFCSNHPGEVRPGTSGRPVDGYSLELRAEDGSVIGSPDVPGFLWVRGDSIAAGYWQRPAETADNFVDGWLRTGDVYSRSADGYWQFVGRNSDMIKAGGIWVSPAEVESVLLEHDDVLEAAVVGGRSAAGLEEVVAFVVPRSGRAIDVAALAVHCRDRMAGFKRPRQIRVVEALPKTATGKIRRYALREALGV